MKGGVAASLHLSSGVYRLPAVVKSPICRSLSTLVVAFLYLPYRKLKGREGSVSEYMSVLCPSVRVFV